MGGWVLRPEDFAARSVKRDAYGTMAEKKSQGGYELTDDQYRHLVALIYEQAGISLGESKKELLHARLGKILRRREIPGFGAYISLLRNDSSGDELVGLLDAVSTNVTHFFREEAHFAFLAKHLANCPGAASPRIWSAGCSSGEEPYSIAITLLESGVQPVAAQPCILATDISTRVLERAAHGVYPEKAVEHMDPVLVRKYFLRGRNNAEGMIRVKKSLAAMIAFQRMNLVEPVSLGRRFQFVFCRNVMIYFDNATRQELVAKFHRALEPGGYLIVGHSESLNGVSHQFQYVQPTVYRKM